MSITIMMSNALHSKTNKISYSMRVLVLMLFGGVGQHTGENGMRDMKWLKTEKMDSYHTHSVGIFQKGTLHFLCKVGKGLFGSDYYGGHLW